MQMAKVTIKKAGLQNGTPAGLPCTYELCEMVFDYVDYPTYGIRISLDCLFKKNKKGDLFRIAQL